MVTLRKIYQNILSSLFTFTGMKPWARGYGQYKELNIQKVLQDRSFNPDQLVSGYGFRLDERIVEYPWFFSRLPNVRGTLLDAGSVLNFEYLLDNILLQNKNIYISTLAPESVCYADKGISYVFEDLRDACFKDNFFDWIASLSTVEHIGLDNTLLYTSDLSKRENATSTHLLAIKEYRRMLKQGGKLYLSFPFGLAKNHGWFQVFDSEMVDEIIDVFSPTRVTEFHYRYTPEGWKNSSREESKNATCFDIHAQKSYDSDYAAFSRAIVCLELMK